jgi:hypothetical protein
MQSVMLVFCTGFDDRKGEAWIPDDLCFVSLRFGTGMTRFL